MALTTQEEAQVKLMIEAFQNGKTLDQLPMAQGTNPFNMLSEVLDENGESRKATIAALLPYVEEQCSYGIEFDTAVSSPDCTRIGNMALHKSLPVHNTMKGVLLNDEGQEVEFLHPVSWEGQTRDGSRGQVMVRLPEGYYRKFETEGTKRRVKLSQYPIPGYHYVPTKYVSAYQATMQRSTGKLASVVNMNADYRGGGNRTNYDNTYRTDCGKPVTAISRTAFRTAARKRNNSATTEWNCMTYDIQKDLYWLFAVEYATLNTQKAFDAQLTPEGYHQGGLGDGVTTWEWGAWSTFNGNYPFIPCGYTDNLGNATGVKNYELKGDKDAPIKTFSIPRYRGVENPFGHIWQWTDGINIRISPNKDKGDGLSKVFICSDPSKFNDTNYTGYRHVGNEARTEGYVKSIIFGEEGDIMPDVVGGGSTTYFCDYHYTNIPETETLRGVLFGGNANDGASAGLVFAYSSYAPSATDATFGSRLCFIPAKA